MAKMGENMFQGGKLIIFNSSYSSSFFSSFLLFSFTDFFSVPMCINKGSRKYMTYLNWSGLSNS